MKSSSIHLSYLIVCIDYQTARDHYNDDLKEIRSMLDGETILGVKALRLEREIVVLTVGQGSIRIDYIIGTAESLKGRNFDSYTGIADPFNLIQIYTGRDISNKRSTAILEKWLKLPWTRL